MQMRRGYEQGKMVFVWGRGAFDNLTRPHKGSERRGRARFTVKTHCASMSAALDKPSVEPRLFTPR